MRKSVVQNAPVAGRNLASNGSISVSITIRF